VPDDSKKSPQETRGNRSMELKPIRVQKSGAGAEHE
jgi:hypothetical protein